MSLLARNVSADTTSGARERGANGDDREVLAEQIEYYRARVDEYDDSYERRGRHDHGHEANETWLRELGEVRAALDRLPLNGADVLELAAGTGVWTEALTGQASRVMAVDAVPEMLERNRARLGARAAKVDYVRADLFSWRPPRAFDAVVFCFWLSHVPAGLLDAFLGDVAYMLCPRGWVFFADSRRRSRSLGGGECPRSARYRGAPTRGGQGVAGRQAPLDGQRTPAPISSRRTGRARATHRDAFPVRQRSAWPGHLTGSASVVGSREWLIRTATLRADEAVRG
jgi:SAM-dependent methyltransferase